jgi:hypothetical protein
VLFKSNKKLIAVLFVLVGWTLVTKASTPAYSLWSDTERMCEVPVTVYTSQL